MLPASVQVASLAATGVRVCVWLSVQADIRAENASVAGRIAAINALSGLFICSSIS